MKYIIEIEDEPLVRKSALHGEDAVYRAAGFKSLVFDKTGLEKLTRYDPFTDRQSEIKYERDDAYQKGLEDAWGLAQEIDELDGIDWQKIFGSSYKTGILSSYSYGEAFDKMHTYKNLTYKYEKEEQMLNDFCNETGYSLNELSELIKRMQE